MVPSESAEFLYKTTDAPRDERCIRWNDPDLGIAWLQYGSTVLSAKDATGFALRNSEAY